MKRRVAVITANDYLYRKIELASLDYAECKRPKEGEETLGFDCVIADIDTASAPDGALTVSRRRECDLAMPFGFCALEALIKKKRSAQLTVSSSERVAYLRGEAIRLTEVEHALLLRLVTARDFVSREQLLLDVWGEGADEGVINVYIHYLRRKLEVAGERIILSSRRLGYRIDEKYLKEGEYAEID